MPLGLASTEGLGRIGACAENLDQLQYRKFRMPKRWELFVRLIAKRQVEPSCLGILSAGMSLRECLDLKEQRALIEEPSLYVLMQSSADAHVALFGFDGDAMNFPTPREVPANSQERDGRRLIARHSEERWETLSVSDVLEKRVLDSEPVR